MRTFRRIAAGVALICLLPFAAALLASLIGTAAGCDFDVNLPQACTVAGRDISGALQVLGSLGYATFFTVPLLLLTGLVWLGAEIVHWLRRPATG